MNELLQQRINTLNVINVIKPVTVITHSGVFHADEIVGVALLEELVGKCQVIRTRHLPITLENSVVLDVGEGIFDHHGPCLAANGDFAPGIPHCAASLIYETLVAMRILPEGDVLRSAITAVAAQDNGRPIPSGIHHPFGCLAVFNPAWDESREAADKRFQEALATAKVVLDQLIRQQASSNKAASLIEGLPADRIVILPAAGLPWVSKLAAADSPTKFVIFLGDGDTWFCQCVPRSSTEPMSQRIPLPAAWAGKRDAELSTVAGIPGGVFCHIGRFLSGWKTREAAIEAAKAAASM